VENLTLLVAGVAAAAILFIAIGIAMSGGGSGINARLERYASTKPDKPEASASGESGLQAALNSSQAMVSSGSDESASPRKSPPRSHASVSPV